MKKIFFSALAVMAVGAAVMGGKAYNANNNDMSELFLGGVEQIAEAEVKNCSECVGMEGVCDAGKQPDGSHGYCNGTEKN